MPFSTQTPPAVLSRDDEHADVFVIGTDGRVWTNWWAQGHNENRWNGWFPITDKPDDPTVASFSKQTPPAVLSRDSEHADVFVIGTDGRVWTNWWAQGHNENRWNGWFPITDKPDDPTVASFSKQTPPAVLSRDSEHADVFVIGTDGRVWTNWWAQGHNENRWNGWYPITETPTKVVRVKVLRYLWASPAPDALASLQWPDDAYADIFSNANGWSLSEFWWRATLGLIDLRFDIAPWHVLHQQQADVMKDRNKILEVCRTQALDDDGVSFEGFQHIIAFVHAPPSNAGANGQFGDAVFDQNPFTLGFYQHELGHLLGFEHAFGADGPYDDNYCVMGWSRRQERSFPAFASFSQVDLLPGVDLFHSERRLAAAALYRYMDDFKASPSVLRVDPTQPTTVTLVALSEARFGEPVLAVLGTPNGELTVEYRTDSGDDSGVKPAAVVHSIGRHDPGEGKHEVDPIWFEAAVSAQVGAHGQVGNLVVEVMSIAPDRRTMTVTVHP